MGKLKDQLVTFETAKLAAEKGFNEECIEIYSSEGILQELLNVDENKMYKYIERGDFEKARELITGVNSDLTEIGRKGNCAPYVTAPTQALLQRWLRDIHGIHIQIPLQYAEDYYPWIFFKSASMDYRQIFHGTYEEALEKGLQEALNLIKT